MRGYKEQLSGKKATLMGLGLLGRQLNVAKFLLQNGVKLIITDLKSKEELAPSIEELKEYKGDIEYVLGRHRLGDFEGIDMVIVAANVPDDSEYLERACENGIPVEMDASLFQKMVRELTEEDENEVRIVGVTGTRGKSTVTHLIHHILDKAASENALGDGARVYMGGNIDNTATLPLIHRVQPGDYVVLELDSWQLSGFGDERISPNIGVFTNFFPDHLDYYDGSIKDYFKDKSNIFRYQEEGDYLVVSEQVLEVIQKYYKKDIKSTLALARANRVPESWKSQLLGIHNKENIALAAQVAELLDVRIEYIRDAIEEFKPLSGRLEYVKKVKDIKIYNDASSTSPEAAMAGLRALSEKGGRLGNILLITGGADKGLDYGELAQVIDETCKAVITLQGTATGKLRGHLKMPHSEVDNLKTAVYQAMLLADKGDVLIFSPASASFGEFKNAYERGERFVEVVRAL